MFEMLVFGFILSVYVALGLAFALFVMRIVVASGFEGPLPSKIAIVLLPAGIGYFFFVGERSRTKRLYITLTVVMSLFAAIGAVWVAFLNIPEFAAWFFYG